MNPRPRCLILGTKQTLDRMGPALDHVLEALDIDRAPVLSPGELATGAFDADLVIAEVTKPPPTIAFELGVAVAKQIPVVYLVAEGTSPAPVFTPYLSYDPSLPPARLAFLIAKRVESVLADDPSQPAEPAWRPAYVVGERFVGIVSHVSRGGGFALVHVIGRPTAMLHVSRMSQGLAALFHEGLVRPGAAVDVEVVEIDERRRRVHLQEVALVASSDISDPASRALLTLYRECADIERMIREAADAGLDTLEYSDYLDRRSDMISALRTIRNSAAHGEAVAFDVLLGAAGTASDIAANLKRLTAGWAGRGSNPEPTA